MHEDAVTGPVSPYPLVVTGRHRLQYGCSACLRDSLAGCLMQASRSKPHARTLYTTILYDEGA